MRRIMSGPALIVLNIAAPRSQCVSASPHRIQEHHNQIIEEWPLQRKSFTMFVVTRITTFIAIAMFSSCADPVLGHCPG